MKNRFKKKGWGRFSERAYQTVITIIIVLIALICVVPLIYVVSVSLVTDAEYYAKDGLLLFPIKPTLAAYKNILLNNTIILHSLWINIARTICGTAISLINTILLGYILSRTDLPGNKAITIALLVAMLFSGGLIPTFLTINAVGLYNTFAILFIMSFVSVWNTLIFKQFFCGLPKELEESARLDGAGEFRIMTRIIVPMSMPVVAAIGLFTAVGLWNDWFGALIYIQDNDLMPLPLIMHNMFKSSTTSVDVVDPSMTVTAITTKMAVTVVGSLPILLVYPFLQKYFVKGVYTGAVKG